MVSQFNKLLLSSWSFSIHCCCCFPCSALQLENKRATGYYCVCTLYCKIFLSRERRMIGLLFSLNLSTHWNWIDGHTCKPGNNRLWSYLSFKLAALERTCWIIYLKHLYVWATWPLMLALTRPWNCQKGCKSRTFPMIIIVIMCINFQRVWKRYLD